MSNEDSTISIVIPAFNEEMRIRDTILSYAKEFPGQEILVICDGNDNTNHIVTDLMIKNKNIRLLGFHERLGKGGALVAGFKAAKGEKIGFVDADESVKPEDLKNMFKSLNYIDGVIASRRLRTSRILKEQPVARRMASRSFNMLVRILFGLPFKDTQCGAKVFNGKALRDIISDLKTTGFEIDVEILWKLRNKGYEIIEYPITWSHSEDSKFRLSNSKDMLFSLLKIRFK